MNSLSYPINYTERRSGVDRRKENRSFVDKYLLIGKRETMRREEDKSASSRLDRYSNKTLAVILTIILLSTLDAIFTLSLVKDGATELNPIMAFYLNHSPLLFFWMKYLLTLAPILLVLLHQNAYFFRNKIQVKKLYILYIVPYFLVVNWEMFLLISRNN